MATRKQRGGAITGLFRKKSKTRKIKSRSRTKSLISTTKGVGIQRVKNALGLGSRVTYRTLLTDALKQQQEELPIESLEIMRDSIQGMTRMYKKLLSRGEMDRQLQIDFDIILYDLSYIFIELIQKYTRARDMDMNNTGESSFDEMLRKKLAKYKEKVRIDTVLENVSRLTRFITSILDYEEDIEDEERDDYDMFALELVGEIGGVLKKHKKEIGKIKQELYKGLIVPPVVAPAAAAPANAEDKTINELLGKLAELGF